MVYEQTFKKKKKNMNVFRPNDFWALLTLFFMKKDEAT